MKQIFSRFLFLCLISTSLWAQQPEVGFIRIVNAVPQGKGKAKFLVNGQDLYLDGYGLGQDTGGYGVKSGSVTVQVEKDGLRKGSTTIQLATGETMTFIAFAEEIDEDKKSSALKDETEDKPRWRIRILRLKQEDAENGFGLSFVSVCDNEEVSVSVSLEQEDEPKQVFTKRLRVTKLNLGARRSEIQLMSGERNIGLVSTDSPGNYVVILYDDEKGETQALSFYDPRFVVAG